MFIPKISQNHYLNTFNKDVYKIFRNNFRDRPKDQLDPRVEFVRLCPYFELETLKFLYKEM